LMLGQHPEAAPGALDFRQPHFSLLKPILDAASRASWVLGQGHHECEVLLIRPNVPAPHSVPGPWTTPDDPETLFYRHYEGISKTLLTHQIDFDVADERLLGELGRATRRRLA